MQLLYFRLMQLLYIHQCNCFAFVNAVTLHSSMQLLYIRQCSCFTLNVHPLLDSQRFARARYASTLETTQGQIDGFFSQLSYIIGWHLCEIDLRFASGLPPVWQCSCFTFNLHPLLVCRQVSSLSIALSSPGPRVWATVILRANSYANTFQDVKTWFQSKLLHVYLNSSKKDLSV